MSRAIVPLVCPTCGNRDCDEMEWPCESLQYRPCSAECGTDLPMELDTRFPIAWVGAEKGNHIHD